MVAFQLMAIVFTIGYLFIIFEHTIKVDKAAIAMLTAVLVWTIYAVNGVEILSLNHSTNWLKHAESLISVDHDSIRHFITEGAFYEHLAEISSIIFFLIGAMTIVETVDKYQGFRIITTKIKAKSAVRLLWMIGILSFFMSALLDNLTSTIIMIAVLRKMIDDKETRWLFAGIVVISANAGGAWSPIGDITTIMLWIGGQITAQHIITSIFLPSLVSLIVPLIIMSFIIKGEVVKPSLDPEETDEFTTYRERLLMLILGGCALLSVPIFKTYTHLPPFMGMLLGLSIMWIITDRYLKRRKEADRRNYTVTAILKHIDIPTALFFFGVLSSVAALQSAGHLDLLAKYLDSHFNNLFVVNLLIGVISSIVDNVPLVAAAMGMYPIAPESAGVSFMPFIADGTFWSFLAYCAGTGGSLLIIGSAAGVMAMGLEKIEFGWYLKHISWIALMGYIAGGATYVLMNLI